LTFELTLVLECTLKKIVVLTGGNAAILEFLDWLAAILGGNTIHFKFSFLITYRGCIVSRVLKNFS